jgi:hypothetical protein
MVTYREKALKALSERLNRAEVVTRNLALTPWSNQKPLSSASWTNNSKSLSITMPAVEDSGSDDSPSAVMSVVPDTMVTFDSLKNVPTTSSK